MLRLASNRAGSLDPASEAPFRVSSRPRILGGFVLPGQKPFDVSVRGGDPSFREIPAHVDASTLVESHRSRSFDHSGMRSDPNLAFPVDRLRELGQSGRIGSVNHRHISFMGSITAPGRLVKQTAFEAARLLAADGVDVALLVPV